MSLPKVTVDCTSINKPGQLGVAIGRSISKKNLRLINFQQRHVIESPQEICQYYDIFSRTTDEDLSCCRVQVVDPLDETPLLHVPLVHCDNDNFESDCEEDEVTELDKILGDTDLAGEQICVPYLEQYNELELMNSVKYEECVVDFHTEMNEKLAKLSQYERLQPSSSHFQDAQTFSTISNKFKF